MLYTLQILLFHATLKKEIHVLQKSAHTFKGVFMKKNLQTAFITRQHMLSRDFELYYYNDHNLSKVDLHSHNYYEFYFFMEGQGKRMPESHVCARDFFDVCF